MMATSRERNEFEQLEWTPEEEVQLFLAMEGVRPVGINRHFHMATIVDRLSKALQRDIGSEAIWMHLRTLYNLKALDEQETTFLIEECDFSLPESDFGGTINKRRQEDTERGPAVAGTEQDVKKCETKPETAIVKISVSKAPTSLKDVKDPEKEEKDGKDRDAGTVKIKTKINDSYGGNDSGPKRSQKRTRGSMSIEPGHSNASSPANTPPNGPNTKRRRI